MTNRLTAPEIAWNLHNEGHRSAAGEDILFDWIGEDREYGLEILDEILDEMEKLEEKEDKQYLVIDESQKGDTFIDQYETLEAANTAAREDWDKLTAHDRKIHGKRRIYVVQAPDVPEGEYLSDEYLSCPKYFDSDKPQEEEESYTIKDATAYVISRTRRRAGLTQEEMAELLGMTQQAYGQYETGKTHPSVDQFARIVQAMGEDPAEILAEIIEEVG